MSHKPLPIRVTQLVGLTSSFFLGATLINTTVQVVPRLLESPSPLLLQQWKKMFDKGKSLGVALAVLASSNFFYLAYVSNDLGFDGLKYYGYLVPGLLNVAILPYTLLVIQPTNDKLIAKAEAVEGMKATDEIVEVGMGDESAHELVDRWATLSLGRGVMVMGASMLAYWTILQ